MKNVAIDGRLYNILNMDKLYLTEKAPQLMSVYYQYLASSFREENIFCVSIVLFLYVIYCLFCKTSYASWLMMAAVTNLQRHI